MANEYSNFIQPTEQSDLGVAIQALINDNLRSFQTLWLAEITEITENKVSVRQVIKANDSEEDMVVSDCLVAFPFSQKWQMQWKLAVGDIGICLVLNRDISLYKENGTSPQLANTTRFKNINDSIFIPLSLFKTLKNDDTNFTIKSGAGGESGESGGESGEPSEITFDNENNLKVVVVKAQTSTINDAYTLTAKGAVSISSEADIIQQAKGAYNITADGDMSATLKGAFKCECNEFSVTAKSPLKIGSNAGTLKACFDAIFQAMDGLSAGLTGPSSNPAGYQAAKPAAQAQIQQIVG